MAAVLMPTTGWGLSSGQVKRRASVPLHSLGFLTARWLGSPRANIPGEQGRMLCIFLTGFRSHIVFSGLLIDGGHKALSRFKGMGYKLHL